MALHLSTTVPLLSLLLLVSLSAVRAGKPQQLYSDDDPVLILNVTNFKATVVNGENAWIIQFFNSWCGHCISFAPTWKRLAEDVKEWKKIISVAAVDCSVVSNEGLCREYEVQSFPTIKLFNIKSKDDDLGERYKGLKLQDDMRHEMIQFVTMMAYNHSVPRLSDLIPTKEESLVSLWQETDSSFTYLLLIVEESTSYVGREILLDLVNFSSVRVLRITPENAELLKDLNVSESSAAVLVQRSKTVQIFLNSDFTRKSVVDYMKKQLLDQDLEQIDEGLGAGDKPEEEISQNVEQKLHLTGKVHLIDLENAIRYIFIQEVPLHKSMTNDTLKAFIDFVRALVQYYPGSPSTISFLTKLFTWLNETENEVLMTDYLKFISSSETTESYLPPARNWVGCQGSQPNLRGYPCSLWKLFHTLTVEAYRMHEADLKAYDPLEVLTSILGYVKHFFSCQECSLHFQEMASSLTKDVIQANDGVLWLWQAHNKANNRLHGAPSEDPEFPKIQFPSSELCATCQLATDDGSQWDLSEVLSYLLKQYSRFSIVSEASEVLPSANSLKRKSDRNDSNQDADEAGLKSDLLEDEGGIISHSRNVGSRNYRSIHQELNVEKIDDPIMKGSSNQKPPMSAWGFSAVDVSLCVMLYACSAVILLSVYFIVIVKRRLRKRYSAYKSFMSV